MSNARELRLELPRPHPAQQQIISEARRFNTVCCGRRWGKIVLGLDRLIARALQGAPTSWWAPSYRTLQDVWREASSTLTPVIVDKSETEHRLALTGGGTVEFWSTDSAGDSARGRKYGLAVVDEAAMVQGLEQFFQATLRPMLSDLRGGAWFLSTPKGLNYFKTLFDRGQDGQRGDWASWQMGTRTNPYIAIEEIEAARMDMTEASFSQEFEAAFVAWEGAVFRRILEAATAKPQSEPEPGHEYAVGVDWGRSIDYTCFVVIDATEKRMVEIDRSNRVDYVIQRSRLTALCQRWRPKVIIAEANSIGQPILEQLWREGLPVQPFTTSNASKAAIIEGLALALERGELSILPDQVLIAELQSFQAEPLVSGMMRYSAPSGSHDDTVIATGLCWAAIAAAYKAREQRSTTYYIDPASGRITDQMPSMIQIGEINYSPWS